MVEKTGLPTRPWSQFLEQIWNALFQSSSYQATLSVAATLTTRTISFGASGNTAVANIELSGSLSPTGSAVVISGLPASFNGSVIVAKSTLALPSGSILCGEVVNGVITLYSVIDGLAVPLTDYSLAPNFSMKLTAVGFTA